MPLYIVYRCIFDCENTFYQNSSVTQDINDEVEIVPSDRFQGCMKLFVYVISKDNPTNQFWWQSWKWLVFYCNTYMLRDMGSSFVFI